MEKQKLLEKVKLEVATEVWSEATKEMNRLQELHEKDVLSISNMQAEAINEEFEKISL